MSSKAKTFGPRYGVKVKKRYSMVVSKMGKHVCPSCKKRTLKRVAKGIYVCSRCGYKMAGKAYYPGD
ncbi:MAG TPA: 50S ribosomal protein L37ae [Candidatus Aenigmarchaeota archaeon]|nr:MAG: 50S ribosomal protein L37ae [Nanoarchaeota archaeon]HDO79995.1 50S ribosomal protein L37ae [Candidatus Aenigmarchaeota archaeon]HEX33047.1 50S ribosomal protein L37ae [Candidatus Aenigmarchaeota archaeon]